MSLRVHVPRRALLASALGLALPAAAFAQCPTADQVGKTIQEVFKRPGIEVKKVYPAALKGLCEVQVSSRAGRTFCTPTRRASYFVTGHLIDAKSGKDLTEETLTRAQAASRPRT